MLHSYIAGELGHGCIYFSRVFSYGSTSRPIAVQLYVEYDWSSPLKKALIELFLVNIAIQHYHCHYLLIKKKLCLFSIGSSAIHPSTYLGSIRIFEPKTCQNIHKRSGMFAFINRGIGLHHTQRRHPDQVSSGWLCWKNFIFHRMV